MESDKNSGKRICQQCGKPFVPRTRAQYFCSSRCGDLAKDKAERERIKVSRAIEARKKDQACPSGRAPTGDQKVKVDLGHSLFW